ncbi:MAG: LTA synthase family protein [Tenericutes bacterium]|jgi:lipoteichoic acid synthase|nr:LTA synthase family protein [Mycoplasmatota bacterium]
MDKTKKLFITKLFSIIFLILLYLEMVFKISIIGFERSDSVSRIFVFTLSYSLILLIFLRILPRKLFKGLSLFLVIFTTFFYFAQDMYYRILSGFFSFTIAGDAFTGIAFLGRIMSNISWIHALYLLPVILGVILLIKYKNVFIPKNYIFFSSTFDFLNSFIIAILLFTTVVHTIPKNTDIFINSPYIYSDFDFYQEIPSAYQTIDKFGVMTYFQRDVSNMFEEDPDESSLYDQINEYLETKTIHSPNGYTDHYKGKNFIMIMAESFDTFAIDPSLTPNIYNLQQKSWSFDNYYSPLYFRNTADTEFMSQTGFYTNRNTVLTMQTYSDNIFPNTLPKLFAKNGYETYAFHNYTDYFYPRSKILPTTMGYDEYYGAERLGMLEYRDGVITNHLWQSDLELMEEAMDILVGKDEPFFSYILTVSGHLPYNKRHPIAEKNIDIIRDIFIEEGREMPVDDILYYHAANYELDLAIGHLMTRLEEENMADDTVIMIFGDHYAYGIDQEDIAEYDETKDIESNLSFQRVPMIIYHPNMIANDKPYVFASIDIMPTVANLFGLNLDYKPVLGKDIFGDQRRSVFFSNGSILTENFFYDLESEEYTFFDDEISEEEALIYVNEYIYRQYINQAILEIDYFRVKERLEE